jgi:hypothetical protein
LSFSPQGEGVAKSCVYVESSSGKMTKFGRLSSTFVFRNLLSGPDVELAERYAIGELGMKGQKMAVWIAVGIGVGVAIGAATHSMPIWICVGVVAGAAVGAVTSRR